jgi:hypothetical protein
MYPVRHSTRPRSCCEGFPTEATQYAKGQRLYDLQEQIVKEREVQPGVDRRKLGRL